MHVHVRKRLSTHELMVKAKKLSGYFAMNSDTPVSRSTGAVAGHTLLSNLLLFFRPLRARQGERKTAAVSK